MKLELIENKTLDMSFLTNSLKSEEEVKLINPSAAFPFDESYWLNFYTRDTNPSISLLLLEESKTIGHSALRYSSETGLSLCFVYLDDNYRGKGYSEKLLSEIESYILNNFDVSEYFLNVRMQNDCAIRFYEKSGFAEISRTEKNIQMRKSLS